MFLNDIELDWIGKIPRHWSVKRIKHLFHIVKEISETPDEEDVMSLTFNGIVKRDISTNVGQLPETYKGYTKIYPDDIVMNPMDLRSGWVDKSKNEGIISPSYYVLKPNSESIDLSYFTYQFQRHYKERIFFPFGQGVSYDYRWGLGKETLLNFPFICPPLPEQRQIVSFLDHKTQKIDELIEKTEQKIELLKEKRTSLINHCVTKGLNPNVEMKDSGVEWIGEIPSHWDKIKTNLIAENLDGKRVPLNSGQRSSMEGDIPYWGSNGVVDHINDFLFDEELVLVGEDGSPFFDRFKDVSFFISGKVWINNHIHVLKPKSNVIPKYLTHSFNCVDYKNFITGSTRDKLTQSDLNRIPHFIPPLPEQKQIVEYLDEQTQKIDTTIEKETKRIELLKEYRQSLISEVVTGKIDVRDYNG